MLVLGGFRVYIEFQGFFGASGFRVLGFRVSGLFGASGFKLLGFRVLGCRVEGFRVFGFRAFGFRGCRLRVRSVAVDDGILLLVSDSFRACMCPSYM